MPSLKLVDTSFEPGAAPRRWLVRILASLGVALFPLLVAVPLDAQTSPRQQQGSEAPKPAMGSKKHHGSKAKGPKPAEDSAALLKEAFGHPGASKTAPPAPIGKKGPKGPRAAKDAKAPESAKAPGVPKGVPSASTTPPRVPVDKLASAKLAAQRWNKITNTLLVEFLARDPERAFEQPWPQITARHLGTFGSGATLRWRRTLTEALAELQLFGTAGLPTEARAQLRALEDWVEAELLMLDAQTPSTSDPAAYVQRAFLALRAAREAAWMSAERRAAELESLLRELPAYFEDARLGLIDPPARWIDLALQDLDDLQELVSAIEQDSSPKPAPKAPKAKKAAAPSDGDPQAALESFRSTLLELRPSAGSRVPSLNRVEWQRLATLRTGTAWTASAIKALCLRELARLDLGARLERAQGPSVDGGVDPLALAWSASARALHLGQEARLLTTQLGPEALRFELETSSRSAAGIARLSVDDGDSSRVFLAGPNGSWPPERTIVRNRSLQGSATALGVRYGLAGEALFALQSRTSKKSVAVLLDNRLLREGLGLYALDWTVRAPHAVAHVAIENPFQGDEALALEFELQKGLEAARLVAAIELHAEGLSLEDAASGFERRTGVDRETARAEVLAAERDPLHGLGYLGLIELQALEARLARLTGPRRGLELSLLFAARHPDLRPSDGVMVARGGSPHKRQGKKTPAKTLENQGGTQQELPRSR